MLLDPLDIFIETGDIDTGSSPNDGEIADTRILFNDGGFDEVGRLLSFFISSGAVEALMGDIIFQAQRDITINSELNLSNQTSGESVVFQAGRDIRLNRGVTTNGANLRFDADSADSTVGAANGVGTFFLDDIDTLRTFFVDGDGIPLTQGGDLTIGAAGISSNISLELLTNGGNISVNSRNGEIPAALALFPNASSALGFGGDVDVRALGNIVLRKFPLSVDSSGEQGAGSVTITSSEGEVDIGSVNASSNTGAGGEIGIDAFSDIFVFSLASTGSENGGNVTLRGGGFLNAFDIDSSSSSGVGGNVTLTGGESIDVFDIHAVGAVGGGDVTLIGQNVFFDNIDTSGGLGGGSISVTGNDSILNCFEGEGGFVGSISSSSTNGAGGNVSLSAPSLIDVGGIDATGLTGSGDIALTGDEINLQGGASSVQSEGALILQPFSSTQAIAIEDGVSDIIFEAVVASGIATLDITTTDLAALADGFSSITIGRDNGQHAITIIDADFNDPVIIQTPGGGSILVSSFDDDTVGLRGQGDASVMLRGGVGEAAATTTLNADIVTSGRRVLLSRLNLRYLRKPSRLQRLVNK